MLSLYLYKHRHRSVFSFSCTHARTYVHISHDFNSSFDRKLKLCSLPLLPLQQRAMKTWIPRIEVYYEQRRMWWSMPEEDSDEILSKVDTETGTCEYFVGRTPWEGGRRTNFNRYLLDFNVMAKTNLDTNMRRPIRIIWTEPPPEVQPPRISTGTCLTSR